MLYSALIGNPVSHSVSPKLFSYIANKAGVEYSHIKIKVDDASQLMTKLDLLSDLGFCGINVTCPYKINCFDLLQDIDDECKKIKSVNTIQVKNGKLKGYNTDGVAAIKAITKLKSITKNDKVVVFGAGGVAHAVVYEIAKSTDNIVIFNENYDVAEEMLRSLNLNFKAYDLKNRKLIQQEIIDADFVVNCTSVGMCPEQNHSIITFDEIANTSQKKKIYFDVVFNPWETKFIQYAKECGNQIISGGIMLIYQALYAFEVWTGIKIELNQKDFESLRILLIDETNRI